MKVLPFSLVFYFRFFFSSAGEICFLFAICISIIFCLFIICSSFLMPLSFIVDSDVCVVIVLLLQAILLSALLLVAFLFFRFLIYSTKDIACPSVIAPILAISGSFFYNKCNLLFNVLIFITAFISISISSFSSPIL